MTENERLAAVNVARIARAAHVQDDVVNRDARCRELFDLVGKLDRRGRRIYRLPCGYRTPGLWIAVEAWADGE
jgi:hypothetical protein